MSIKRPPKGYCVAPWTEGVLFANGALRTCCISETVQGNWQEDGLESAWHSPQYQKFRGKIIDGEFPEESCRRCYNNNTNRTLSHELRPQFDLYTKSLFRFLGREIEGIAGLEYLLSALSCEKGNKYEETIRAFYGALAFVKQNYNIKEIKQDIQKLELIADIICSFFCEDMVPARIAPYRQVEIVTKCNARCIQCLDRYTGGIKEGTRLDERYLLEAFSHSADMIGFFHQGTELLFYGKWKELVVDALSRAAVKTVLFTNSILFTPSNISYLVDKKVLLRVNVSIDGATRETVESIRVNVNFANLIKNLTFYFQYMEGQLDKVPIKLSFVLMQKNYHELPEFVALIDRIRGENKSVECSIAIQNLQLKNLPGYREFLYEQHPSFIGRNELIRIFQETLSGSKRLGIPVSYCSRSLEKFISEGLPFPQFLDPVRILEKGVARELAMNVTLKSGWYAIDDPARIARWVQEKAYIAIQVENKSVKSLVFTAAAFHRPRLCVILVNNNEIGRELIDVEPKLLTFLMELDAGENEICIESKDGADAPSDVTEQSLDNRKLSFHIRGLEIV